MSPEKERLEYLREELRNERLSWGEVAELQELAPFIDPGDVELMEAAGVPEHFHEEEMTRDEALDMIKVYQGYARDTDDVLFGIRERFPEDGSEAKAMRWLGFCQGTLTERNVFSLEEVKEHSRDHTVPPMCSIVSRLQEVRATLQNIDSRGGLGHEIHRWLVASINKIDTITHEMSSG